MSQPTLWERVKTGGKSGFDRVYKTVDKLGPPVNRLSNKLGSEAFWPTTLDKESDKAARILKTFCKDGFYKEEDVETEDGPKKKQKVVKKIPTSVIREAKGLAIFTTMRTGLYFSGASGSGVLIARKEDGTWSPPSGIMLHTAGLGFLVGVDIYDCVVVINTDEALEAFTKIRCTLGSEVSVSAGPVGAGGVVDSEVHKRQSPIFTYLKSRGFYAGVQIDGTVIIERTDENERFYGERIPVKDILAGKARYEPSETRRLLETVRAAQGDTDVDESLLPTEPPPGDYEIDDGHVFGVPDREDPDPYGVLALEKEGFSIKEAHTQKRASWEVFSFNPSPTSPVHNVYERQSLDRRRSFSTRNSWRVSGTAGDAANTSSSLRNSMDQVPTLPPRPPQRSSVMSDMGTQTDDLPPEPGSPSRWSGRGSARHSRVSSVADPEGHYEHMQKVPEDETLDTSPARRASQEDESANRPTDSAKMVNGYTTPPRTPSLNERSTQQEDDHDEDVHIEEPVVQSVQTAQPATPQVISKAKLVDVPKRLPPRLPPRNPNRSAGPVVIDGSPKGESTEEASVDSKHDSAHEPPTDKEADTEPVKDKLERVKLDDSDDEEITRPDPWAKVEETRWKEGETSTIMPGGFN